MVFDEKALYLEIVRVWGYYGAHAEVFRAMYLALNHTTPDWFYPHT